MAVVRHTSDPIPVADPGLQAERTALSWSRTALAMLVCSMTLLRWSGPYPAVVFGAIILLALLAVVLIVSNRRTYRTEALGLMRENIEANVAGVALVTVMLVVLGGIGLYLLIQV